ncbi:MAG TPA: sulfate ABC transporter substrate-binding protein [Acidimicrobiales bacterium]
MQVEAGRIARAVALGLSLTLVAAACGGDDGGGGAGGGSIDLVAYSTPQEAYADIIAAFKEDGHDGVDVSESYGGSGDQSRAVEAGQPADVVEFSLEPDMDRLVESGLVADDWNGGEHGGMVTDSVVVFVVRSGNPLDIQSWDDLTADGVEVVTPNPFTSGGARWNVLAGYGAKVEQGASEDEATEFLHDLFANVIVQDDSARNSLQTFTGGAGDVLIAYENEAIFAQESGEDIDYVVPDETILIENPVAVTTDGAENQAAADFVDFLFTDEAQRLFADHGYRPVVEDVLEPDEFPEPSSLFTVDDLGGWSEVSDRFFDPEDSIMADVERGIGVSTGG